MKGLSPMEAEQVQAIKATLDGTEPVRVPRPRVAHRAVCGECGRVFDLTDSADAAEWAYGHDCEA